jgi:Na+-driven multidrug efflux pump
MAWPVVVSFTLRQTFATVDLVYARFLDQPGAVAAIGLWVPFQEVFAALWVGLSAGMTAAIAHALGRGDHARVEGIRRRTLQILTVVVVLMELAGIVALATLSNWGLPEDLAASFRTYGGTLLIGMPLVAFWSVWPDSIVKAHYDTRATMLAGIWATVANVVLNTLFVFAFGLGLFGIALATVLSRIVALLYAMRRASDHEQRRRDKVASRAVAAVNARSILRLGVPAALTFGLAATESVLVNRLLLTSPDPTDAVAGFGVMNAILRLALMPAAATSVAVLPFVARSFASGAIQKVRTELRQAVLLAIGFGTLFTIPAGVLFPDSIGAFFLDDAQRENLGDDLTRDLLARVPILAFAITPFVVLRPTFEAMQRARAGVVAAVARYALLSWPLILLGDTLAPTLRWEPALAMQAGMILAAALASVIVVWMLRGPLGGGRESPA